MAVVGAVADGPGDAGLLDVAVHIDVGALMAAADNQAVSFAFVLGQGIGGRDQFVGAARSFRASAFPAGAEAFGPPSIRASGPFIMTGASC